MSYVLNRDPRAEFDRLEAQSKASLYDFRKELALSGIKFSRGMKILDAGTGSGIVARYLAQEHGCEVVGCDQSAAILIEARRASQGISNISFQVESLERLSFDGGSFDAAICRYVLEHLDEQKQKAAVSEIFRCLKDGGRFCAIDVDGFLHNIHPQTPLVSRVLAQLEKSSRVDLRVGRKLSALLRGAGFKDVQEKIEVLQIKEGEAREAEAQMMSERFQNAIDFFTQLAGSRSEAEKFFDEYIGLIRNPAATLFYNMFVVTGTKASLRLL